MFWRKRFREIDERIERTREVAKHDHDYARADFWELQARVSALFKYLGLHVVEIKPGIKIVKKGEPEGPE